MMRGMMQRIKMRTMRWMRDLENWYTVQLIYSIYSTSMTDNKTK